MSSHDNSNSMKRKLDDDDIESLAPSSVRIRKDQTRIQFFVRLFSGGKTLVLQADSSDTVESLYEKIESITGIPSTEQRLIYRGKQLQDNQTLSSSDNDNAIQNDSSLQLVARMRSTTHPHAWQLMNDLRSLIFTLCKNKTDHPQLPPSCSSDHLSLIIEMLTKFLTMIADLAAQNKNKDTTHIRVAEYIQIFISSSVPAALVMLYVSPVLVNKSTANKSIYQFIRLCGNVLPKDIHKSCTGPILYEFCKLLRRAAGVNDPLFCFCRSSLGAIVQSAAGITVFDANKSLGLFFPFVRDLAASLSRSLELCMGSSMLMRGFDYRAACDFVAFMLPVRHGIISYHCCPISLPLVDEGNCKCEVGSERSGILHYREQIECLHNIFFDLLEKIDMCLKNLESRPGFDKPIVVYWWSQFLVILKELHSISKLYEGLEKVFWEKMMERKVSLCFLIMRFAQRSEDHRWVLEHKEVTNFEVRRHFAMMLLPEVRDENEELYEMLIDRSQLLEESFEYIGHADPASLRGGLFMEFKNEEATGPGVLREWFFLVCQAIFNPQNALFIACPNDCKRRSPNPASKVDPLHLEYFIFSGRMIALALMHKIQISIALDRVFFLRLAGKKISLEDIRDADPYLYRGCKQILEMDPEMVDQDILGLTFVSEIEELGSREVVELCPNGKNTVVNSKNRSKYVNLLIQHRFATSISQQVAHFLRGFADITTSKLPKTFFQSLDLEDLDWMLYGSESVSVEDWKAHTDYKGYNKSDPQISWFWKIVGRMSAEQRKVLLFFWTSVKSLPLEGFGGLGSRLYIYKTSESRDHLPSSHTCFYRLCFPPYESMTAMEKQLGIITQEHVGCSFGTG